jgi:hypothetical protein
MTFFLKKIKKYLAVKYVTILYDNKKPQKKKCEIFL